MDYQKMVEEFHKAFGIPIGKGPKLIGQIAFGRRMRLILEELSEYSEAVASGDIVEIADALGDILYVVFGTAIEHGLPMDRIFQEIHNSNMSKTGGSKGPDGKWIKPADYKLADLSWLRGSLCD